ncbi:MAG: quinone-dependent dihydroorotate dehydrogenase [Polyangiaceae bacterium]|nr:quinone-dependent dihydroorotate dehydrogenase [Polyangiaceae bacterium]
MYHVVRPLFFSMNPTRAHSIVMSALGPVEGLAPLRALTRAAVRTTRDPRLEVRKMGLVFPSPIGLAAGLDKNADRARAFASFGFGHVELGTVTAQAQAPNPFPNLFRLPADRALINRLGFPNEGASVVAARIARRKNGILVPVGISIGKSRSVSLDPLDDARNDYLASFRAVRSVADFVVINVSSPNTKDLRAMQAADVARMLFDALLEDAEQGGVRVPLLVKIAPDLDNEGIDAICDVAKNAGLSGIVATNTTVSRDGLTTTNEELARIGAGGLSGKPLFLRSIEVVKRVRARVGSQMCVIGVGGVDSVDTALAMLRAGADLVQVFTGFIYVGPTLPSTIAHGLVARMDAAGAQSLAELTASI